MEGASSDKQMRDTESVAGSAESTEDTSGGAPSGEAPSGEAPSGEAPGGEAPSGEAPGGEAPGGGAPSGEAPGGKAPGVPSRAASASARPPHLWSEEEVEEWARHAGLDAQTVAAVAANRLTGHWLLRLKDSHIREIIPPVGPRLAFAHSLALLREYCGADSSGDAMELAAENTSPVEPARASIRHDAAQGARGRRDTLPQRCERFLSGTTGDLRALWNDMTEVYGENLYRGIESGFTNDPKEALAILRVAMLATTAPQGDAPHELSLQYLYDGWEETTVSRVARDAYVKGCPEMDEVFKVAAAIDEVRVFDGTDAMAASLEDYMGRFHIGQPAMNLLLAYAQALWDSKGAENVGTYPPPLFALKKIMVSGDERWLSLCTDCPLRAPFEAAQRCGIVPRAERLGVITLHSSEAASPCVVRDATQELLVYIVPIVEGETPQGHPDAMELLVRTYTTTTASWPLSFEEKVSLLRVAVAYPTMTVVPRRTIGQSDGDIDERSWCHILRAAATFPDLTVTPHQTAPAASVHNDQSTGSVSGTAFTPDPDLRLSGWVDCPWNPSKYYMRHMDPRVSCHYDQSTRMVTCADSSGFLAVVEDAQQLCAYIPVDSDSADTLEDAPDNRKICPVHCRRRGDSEKYTLLHPSTGDPLLDPAFVDMAPSVFASRVVQFKNKCARDKKARRADTECETRPLKVRRKNTDDRAESGSEPDDRDAGQEEQEDVCDICESSRDEPEDPLFFCEALGPHGGTCTRCTHMSCMKVAQEPRWSFCREHSNEMYNIRSECRALRNSATTGPGATHSKTSWSRDLRAALAEHGEDLGETTVREFLQFDPGDEFEPHNEQGSLATNLSFMRYWRARTAAACPRPDPNAR